MRSDGDDIKRLTNNKAFDGGPSWSPNGKYVVFFSDREGNMEIYILRLADLSTEQITFNGSENFDPIIYMDN